MQVPTVTVTLDKQIVPGPISGRRLSARHRPISRPMPSTSACAMLTWQAISFQVISSSANRMQVRRSSSSPAVPFHREQWVAPACRRRCRRRISRRSRACSRLPNNGVSHVPALRHSGRHGRGHRRSDHDGAPVPGVQSLAGTKNRLLRSEAPQTIGLEYFVRAARITSRTRPCRWSGYQTADRLPPPVPDASGA